MRNGFPALHRGKFGGGKRVHNLCLQNSGPLRAPVGSGPKLHPGEARSRTAAPTLPGWEQRAGPQQASRSVRGLRKVLVSLPGEGTRPRHSHVSEDLALPSGPCLESR